MLNFPMRFLLRTLCSGLVLIALPCFADPNPFTAESAVYKVEVRSPTSTALGTGVLVGQNKILTNCHVVKNPGQIVVTHRQSRKEFKAYSYFSLGSYDACVITGDFPAGTPVKFAEHLQEGEAVWHFGYPRGIPGYGGGKVLGLVKMDVGYVLESATFCNPGSSGGPLVNARGELVGLNFGVRSLGTRSMCLSIPVVAFEPYYSQMR